MSPEENAALEAATKADAHEHGEGKGNSDEKEDESKKPTIDAELEKQTSSDHDEEKADANNAPLKLKKKDNKADAGGTRLKEAMVTKYSLVDDFEMIKNQHRLFDCKTQFIAHYYAGEVPIFSGAWDHDKVCVCVCDTISR